MAIEVSTIPLPEIGAADLDSLETPTLKIRTDNDVLAWKSTRGYQSYLLFLRRLSVSVIGHALPQSSDDYGDLSATVTSTLTLLDKLDHWIDEIPPLPTPQRFGNLAFRTWGRRLEDNADEVLTSLLPERLHGCVRLLKPYLVISFGSFTRMDYGTGHEAAFGILLLCLTLVRFFQSEPEEERNLVLVVFTRYLRLCWKLQDVYKLEPAGSHGVWGLDDFNFLGYIFGSGQLRDQADVPVSSVLRTPLPPTNLYYLSISRIHEVKFGPFHEHSSQLYAIATGVPNWGKVNSGLFKMYEAEVLGKRVVVQHIPVGGLLEWESHGRGPPSSMEATHRPGFEAITRALWASQSPAPNSMAPPTLPPPSIRAEGAGWSSSSISSRSLDRTLLPPPIPNEPSFSRLHEASTTLLSSLPTTSHPPRSSVVQSSLHSPAKRSQTHALTDGHIAPVVDPNHADSTRSSSMEEAGI